MAHISGGVRKTFCTKNKSSGKHEQPGSICDLLNRKVFQHAFPPKKCCSDLLGRHSVYSSLLTTRTTTPTSKRTDACGSRRTYHKNSNQYAKLFQKDATHFTTLQNMYSTFISANQAVFLRWQQIFRIIFVLFIENASLPCRLRLGDHFECCDLQRHGKI